MPPKAQKTNGKAAAAAADNGQPSFLTDREMKILVQCLRTAPRSLGELNVNIPKAAENLNLASGTVRNVWTEIKRKFKAEADDNGEPAAEDANPAPRKRARTLATTKKVGAPRKSGAAAAAGGPVRGRRQISKTSIMAPMAAPLARPGEDDDDETEEEKEKGGKEEEEGEDTVEGDGADAGDV